jgi:hypothetical protein
MYDGKFEEKVLGIHMHKYLSTSRTIFLHGIIKKDCIQDVFVPGFVFLHIVSKHLVTAYQPLLETNLMH